MIKPFFQILFVLAIFCLLLTAQTAKTGTSTPAKKKTTVVTEKPDLGDKVINGRKGPEGQAVYEGVKGGIYYINKNGNKTYLKENDKIVANKKGPDGQIVYVGPQGGEYYINKNGNKVYLKNKK
jgi:hypothetical protein